MESKYTSLIERYFDQTLNNAESREVGDLLKNDVDFKQEFELFEQAYRAIELKTLADLKDQAKAIDIKTSQKTTRLPWMKIAASLVAFLVLGAMVVYYELGSSNQTVFTENYQTPPNYVTRMGDDTTGLKEAMKYYDAEEYAKAIPLLEKLSSQNQEAAFYLGICYIHNNQFDDAINTLKNITGPYQPEAQWNAALMMVKMNHLEDAKQTVDNIITQNKDPLFVKKAKDLKSELRKSLRSLHD